MVPLLTLRAVLDVIDDSGYASFEVTNAPDYFSVGDLVRIETDLDEYNGDWVVNAVSANHLRVNGLTFDSGADGTITLLSHKFTSDDNVYLFINVPNAANTFFSSVSTMYLEDATTFTSSAVAYFNLLSNNTGINRVHKQSLSFGNVNNPLSYQVSLLDTYWPLFSRILNSPVSLLASGYLKRTTFDDIKTFLKPVRIVTEETSNLYYVNRNRGYKGSERPLR